MPSHAMPCHTVRLRQERLVRAYMSTQSTPCEYSEYPMPCHTVRLR
jgi:hypothetical protein